MVRRKRLIALTSGAGALVALVAAALVLLGAPDGDEYVAGEDVEGITSELSRDLPADAPDLRLVDVTAAAGIVFEHLGGTRSTQLPEDMGPGAAWGDVDGDGDQDLFLPNFSRPLGEEAAPGPEATHALFLNRGDGTFEDGTAHAGLQRQGPGLGAAFGDIDGDGDLDLFVTQYGTSLLFENRGDGTFRDVSEASGVSGESGFWTGISWGDVEGDGDLDAYVCGYVQYALRPGDRERTSRQYEAVIPVTLNPSAFRPERNLLFLNDGSGVFTESAEAAGVANPEGRSLSAAWADFDEDGDVDLYVANDVSDNALFLNRGDGTFENASHAAWVADYRGAMGLAVGDPDGDLDLDIFVTHWIAQENALFRSMLSDLRRDERQGPLRFMDVADTLGLGQVALPLVGWGTDFVDFDHDTRVDLFVANGSTFQESDDPSRLVPQPAALYWNGGVERGFFDISPALGPAMRVPHVGRGAAFADFDADGDMDVLLSVQGGSPVLFRNDRAGDGAWLQVRLRGVNANGFGLGARVTVESGGRRQVRVIGASSSYLSQSAYEAHFGLGDADSIELLSVRWPGGGHDELRDVPVRAIAEVTEGGGLRLLSSRSAADAPTLDERGAVIMSGPAARQTRGLSREALREFWEHYRRAQRARAAGDHEAAAAAHRAALSIQPRHEESLYWLGNSLHELGQLEAAGEAWQRLVDVNPASARGHQQLGVLHSTPGGGAVFDLAAAAACFRRTMEINPEQSAPLTRLAEVLVASGQLEEAEERLAEALAHNPDAVSAHYLRGFLRWRDGRSAEALRHLQSAVGAMELEAAPVRGVTSEGDTGAELRRLRRAALRHGLFGSVWDGLRERWGDGGELTVAQVDEEYGRVEAFLSGLPRGG